MGFEPVDLMSPDTHTDDPEPLYEWLRDEAPLYWDEDNELWAVSRYDDVVYVSKHPELFCSGQGVIPKLGLDIWPDEAMINLDGEAHTCQRALVGSAFTKRRIASYGDFIETLTGELITRMAERGEADLVKDLARVLPFRLIARMLGYPADSEQVLDWTDTYTHAGCGPQFVTEEVVEAFGNFCEFHETLLEEKKANRGDDIISAWLDAELDGQRLSEDKLIFEHSLLLVGGAETTRSVIAMGIEALMEDREQLEWLTANIEDDKALDTAVEELIRWSCPFVRMRRTATQDIEMHGKTIREGDEIIMLYPAANRDPRAFEDPQRFDIRRVQKRPALSFGVGKHFCLGSSLARLEIRTVLRALLRRLPDLHLKPGTAPTPTRSSFVRGRASCPIAFTSSTEGAS